LAKRNHRLYSSRCRRSWRISGWTVNVVRILVSDAPGANPIILIATQQTMTHDVWLTERTSLLGFTRRDVGEFGFIRVVVFEQ
jgi:hypothetical protein